MKMMNSASDNWIIKRVIIFTVALPFLVLSMVLWFWGIHALQEGIAFWVGHPIIDRSDEWHPLAGPFLICGPVFTTWYCLVGVNTLLKRRRENAQKGQNQHGYDALIKEQGQTSTFEGEESKRSHRE